MSNAPSYGLWTLVVLNSIVFIVFAFSFTNPRTSRDWRSFAAFSAFIVALFTEMYARLSRKEEVDMLDRFGDEYRRYADRTPRFLPLHAKVENA